MTKETRKGEYCSPKLYAFTVETSALICQSPDGISGSGFTGGVGGGDSSEE